jgi:membrane protein DedA with SNARE-associated domain
VPDLSAWWPFFTAFGALVAAGFGAPIPEEFPVIGAGIWVGSNPDFGPLRWLIFPVCLLGVLISDVTLYSIGRFCGPRLLEHRWVARLVPPEKRAHIEENFHHYGVKILLFIRWLPGIRSPMFVTAGIMRLPFSRFLMADAIAAVIGHSLLFFLAYWFGERFLTLMTEAKEAEDRIGPILVIVVIGAVLVYLLIHFLRRPVPTGDPKEELPPIVEKLASKIIEPAAHANRPPPEPAAGDGAPAERRGEGAKERHGEGPRIDDRR